MAFYLGNTPVGGSISANNNLLAKADVTGEFTLESDFPYQSNSITVYHNIGTVPRGIIVFYDSKFDGSFIPSYTTFLSTYNWPRLNGWLNNIVQNLSEDESVSYYCSPDGHLRSEASGTQFGICNVTANSFKFYSDGTGYYLRAGTYKWGAIL